ncbi:glycine-rich domain-containing protein [Actinacidiphila bryophytorum]|jgi:hypothetical protein|uniref:glycine-rich domain-containing protein n=1 Tax=Actinacidiphila bryophytorum TaxID=1436133 RepID=UPI002176A5BF|nr:hypothetical protein [Actinacidiphila bryophytorum]UWE08574.1 hypothetical protein NYE86_07475 [Actinacidiphila bryophytorum]
MQQPAPTTGLLDPAEFDAVTFTVMDNNLGMARGLAERIVIEALAFVVTCARNPEAPIAPSRTIDEGWHALVLHTALYARLCDRLGAFVHHYPERPDPTRQGADIIARTTALIEATTGHTPDPELWALPTDTRIPVAADCGHSPQCGPIQPIPKPPSGVLAAAG